MTVRLVVADDQTTVREALAALMALSHGVEVLGTATNGADALQITLDLTPDVVLMDLEMPVMGGIEATEQIRRRQPHTQVVALTTFDDDDSVLAAMRAGAIGYLTKDAGREAILRAIEAAAQGQSVLDLNVQRRLLALASARHPRPAPELDGLTGREREILHLIGSGLRNQEIAETLTITEATVKTHINNLFAKAHLTSRADAVRLALTADR